MGFWNMLTEPARGAELNVYDLLNGREQRAIRTMTPAQAETVAVLASEVERERLEKRALRAKGIESMEVIGAAGACGFLKGYMPEFQPLGIDPSLGLGVAAHAGALYCAHEGNATSDRELASYEPHLEHVGNGALATYVYDQMREVGGRLRAQKLAKAQAKPN